MTKDEIKKEIAECEEKLKSLHKELDKQEYYGKRWKPEKDESYYCICFDGSIITNPFSSTYSSNVYAWGNCFKTQKEAEFELEHCKVMAELSDYAEGEDAVWDGCREHWYLYYHPTYRSVGTGRIANFRCGELYFPSNKAAEAAIEAVGEDRIKKYYLKVKE